MVLYIQELFHLCDQADPVRNFVAKRLHTVSQVSQAFFNRIGDEGRFGLIDNHSYSLLKNPHDFVESCEVTQATIENDEDVIHKKKRMSQSKGISDFYIL